MNIIELKKAIKEGSFKNLYIFTGDEIAIRDIYLNKLITATTNKGVITNSYSAETFTDILPKLKSNSLITAGKSLYIIRDDKTILSADANKLYPSLKSGKLQKQNIIIFIFNSIDKRSKFYKAFSDFIVDFNTLSDDILMKYILKEISMTATNCKKLISICENSYNRILLEVDKIKELAKYKDISDDEAFKLCLDNNIFYMSPDGEIFDLLNCILSRNVLQTYMQFDKFKQRGESPLALISLLHMNLKAVLQVMSAQGTDSQLSKVTGLTGFQIKNAMKFVNKYSFDEILRMIKILHFCEKSVKQTGLMDINTILDYLFIKIF